jgi:hypothetical protein
MLALPHFILWLCECLQQNRVFTKNTTSYNRCSICPPFSCKRSWPLLLKFCHIASSCDPNSKNKEILNLGNEQTKAWVLFDRSTCFQNSWSNALALYWYVVVRWIFRLIYLQRWFFLLEFSCIHFADFNVPVFRNRWPILQNIFAMIIVLLGYFSMYKLRTFALLYFIVLFVCYL